MKGHSLGTVFIGLTVLLQLVTAAVYYISYHSFVSNGYGAFSMAALAFLLVGAALNVVLLLAKKNAAAPAVSGLCSFLALLFYIYGIYMYVSVMIAGIDATWNTTFFVVTGLFVGTLIVNVINIFLKQDASPRIKPAQ